MFNLITNQIFLTCIRNWATPPPKLEARGKGLIANNRRISATTQQIFAVFEYVDLVGTASVSSPPRATEAHPGKE